MSEMITVVVQVRTKAPGSAWQQPVQVDRAWWADADEQDRRKFAQRIALQMVQVDFAISEAGEFAPKKL